MVDDISRTGILISKRGFFTVDNIMYRDFHMLHLSQAGNVSCARLRLAHDTLPAWLRCNMWKSLYIIYYITSTVQSPQQMLGPVEEHQKHGLHEGPKEAHQKYRRRRRRVKYGLGDIRKRRSSRCPFALTSRGQEKPPGRWFKQMLIPRQCCTLMANF